LSYEWNFVNIKNIIITSTKIYNISLNSIANPLRVLITGTDTANSIYDIIFLSGRVLILKKIKNIINVKGL